jgi:UV DNA damage endonuclease
MPPDAAVEVPHEQSPVFPVINLGYCCLNSTLRERNPSVHTNRTCIKKTFVDKGLPHVSRLALQNVTDLREVVQWNEEHDIRLFRISSDMFPFWSEYALSDLPDYPAIREALHCVGELARQYNHRLTFHPGPNVVLGTPRADVATKSVIELDHHSRVFDLMGYEPNHWNKINIHVRGVNDSKIKAMDRFCDRFNQLSEGCRKRLTVENDDIPNAYSVDDLLYLHAKIKIPIVFDIHHARFCRGTMTAEEAFHAAIKTWPPGVRPIVHYSESQEGRKPLAHSDYVDGPIAFFGCEAQVDCHIECKAKDKALLQYRAAAEPCWQQLRTTGQHDASEETTVSSS